MGLWGKKNADSLRQPLHNNSLHAILDYKSTDSFTANNQDGGTHLCADASVWFCWSQWAAYPPLRSCAPYLAG
jgi:hypothetical protein